MKLLLPGLRTRTRPLGTSRLTVRRRLGAGSPVPPRRAATLKNSLAAGPRFPAASMARTSKMRRPLLNADAGVKGDAHAVNLTSSMRHPNRTGRSFAPKMKVGLGSSTVPAGPPVILGTGATVSTLKAACAGLRSALPAESMAYTSKLWSPSASAGKVWGELQATKAVLSCLQRNVEFGSVEPKVRVGAEWLVSLRAGEVITVSGAIVSIVNSTRASGPQTPGSQMCTSKLWGPSSNVVVKDPQRMSAGGGQRASEPQLL
jgi:hypothetical protein